MTGKGLGAQLMEWATGHALALACDAIQLSVWSGNEGAQRFYARYGFDKIADIEFWVGSQCDEEFLYELKLRSEEHTSELPSLMRISYAVFCLKQTKIDN